MDFFFRRLECVTRVVSLGRGERGVEESVWPLGANESVRGLFRGRSSEPGEAVLCILWVLRRV